MLDTATPAFAGYVALEGGFFRGSVAAGTLLVSDGANVRLEHGVRFRETYGDVAWANITVVRNCTLEMSGTVVLGQTGGTEDHLFVEESNLVLWPTTQWTLKNSGQFIHNRHGFALITGGEAAHTPVVENGGNRISVYFDGQVRLSAGLPATPNLFAWLGQTTCGSVPADAHVRPAGSWNWGDWTSDVAARDAINAAVDFAALKVVLAQLSRHDGSKIGRSS